MKRRVCLFIFFFVGGKNMRENKFQAQLIKELKELFPGCFILLNDPNYIQGIPDILVLYKDKWALLECKRGAKEKHQPNQKYYVDRFREMSYASFVYPENKEEVLYELQQTFKSSRNSCVSEC